MENVLKYAPVLIPTLNRVDHLKRCIDSLRKNSYAKNTEIYLGVDYPSSDRQWDGYQKIKEYLSQGITGFKEVYIFYHEENLGESNNTEFLENQIYKNHDRLIFTEDDNEFSPNFLEFINKGLILFEDDLSVLAITGHSYPVKWNADNCNVVKVGNLFNAWGYGTWVKKQKKLKNEMNLHALEKIVENKESIGKLYRQSKLLFCSCIQGSLQNVPEMIDKRDGNLKLIDTTLGIYMVSTGKCTIMPIVSLVRNWGDDGSGVHGSSDSVWNKQKIDINKSFEYLVNKDFSIDNRNTILIDKYIPIDNARLYKAKLLYFIYRMIGKKNTMKLLHVYNKIRHIYSKNKH